MANLPKQRRKDLMNKAVSAAGAGVEEIEAQSNSGNPDIAADATAQLVDAGNARDDLATNRAILNTKPENELKPISDDDLTQLETLENAIDTRVRNNQLIAAGLTAATEIIQTAQSVGQILKEA